MIDKTKIMINLESDGDLELLDAISGVDERVDDVEKQVKDIDQKVKIEKDEVIQLVKDNVPDLKRVLKSVRGKRGRLGPKGDKGERGNDGKDGKNGKDGKDGKQGLQGKNGLQGVRGDDGRDGKDGKKGDKGDKGDIGEKGDIPKHQWRGTMLGFENPDGKISTYVDLQGPKGNGATGGGNLATFLGGTKIGSGTALNLISNGVSTSFDGHTSTYDFTSFDPLLNDSMVDDLHRHSELSASDGTPNPALSVDSDGKVGIGTASPIDILHIKDTRPQFNIDGTISGTDGNVGDVIFSNDGDSIALISGRRTNNDDEGALSFLTQASGGDPTEKVRITSDGKVGIGTDSPDRPLDVDGSAFISSGSTNMLDISGSATEATIRSRLSASDSTSQLAFNGNIMRYLISSSEKMRLTSTGLGIGTASPGTELEINQGSVAEASSTGATTLENSALSMGAFSTTNTRLMMGIGSSNYAWLQSQNTGNNAVQDLVLNPIGGNVGIGTAVPSYELEVADSTGSSGINVVSGLGADSFIRFSEYDGAGTAQTNRGYMGYDESLDVLKINRQPGLSSYQDIAIDSTGNVGIGTASPTAVLNLKAGTASASTAPLKFTSGTLLTTPEAGAIEFLTDKYYATQTTGTTRKEIKLVDQYYAEMYEYENTNSTTVGTQNVYHAVNDFSAGLLSGFTFVGGIEGTIASVANYNATVPGTILITNVAHGLSTGDIITIHSTTNYNGTYSITKVTNDTFYVTKAYVATETGEWAMGSYLLASSGSDGVYKLSYNTTSFTSNPNEVIKFELNKNTTALDNIAASAKHATSDFVAVGASGLVSITAGDRIWLSVRNETSAADITVRHANVNITRL